MGVRQIPRGLAEYRIQFGGDGALQGQAECNSLIGRYLAGDGQLTIESFSSAEIACGETHAQISTAISELMNLATYYCPDVAGRLTVISAQGSQLILERLLPLCDEPLYVEQSPDRVAPDRVASDRSAYIVTVAPEFDASSLLHELETDRPDFRLVDAADCSRSFVASMNTNTLTMLRCRTAVEAIG